MNLTKLNVQELNKEEMVKIKGNGFGPFMLGLSLGMYHHWGHKMMYNDGYA